MNKIFLLIILSLQSFLGKSQNKIEKYFDLNWKECDPFIARYYSIQVKEDTVWHRNDFYIPEKTLQMDGYLKDGYKEGWFTYFHVNGKISSKVFFKNGKKNGLVLSFYEDGKKKDSTYYLQDAIIGNAFSWFRNGELKTTMTLDSLGNQQGGYTSYFENKLTSAIGMYSKGLKKNGVWIYYHENGSKSAEINYVFGQMESKKCFDENGAKQSDCDVELHKPEFPGGQKKFSNYMARKKSWPANYRLTHDGKVRVIVEFTVDTKGKIKDITVVQPFHEEFDKVAIKAVEDMPDWKPARQFNRNISEKMKLPFDFVQ